MRVDPADTDELGLTRAARPMEIRGRMMRGWLAVDAESVRTKRQLTSWVGRGVSYA